MNGSHEAFLGVSEQLNLDKEQTDSFEHSTAKKKQKRKRNKDAVELTCSENSLQQAQEVNEPIGNDSDVRFQVLGVTEVSAPRKPVRVVPRWIADATPVSAHLQEAKLPIQDILSQCALSPEIMLRLATEGITHFFPVQCQVIPELVNNISISKVWRPRDICVSAPTGSGKTLCYVLPIIQALSTRIIPAIRAVVMLPVQDLAQQVYTVFQTYTQNTSLKVALLTGQRQSLHDEQKLLFRQSLRGFQSLVDIVVATPGRLLDHLHESSGALSLEHLCYLVIDEADRMMSDLSLEWLPELEDAVFNPKVAEFASTDCTKPCLPALKCLRSKPGVTSLRKIKHSGGVWLQRIMLSATLSQDPERLQQFGLFEPKLFSVVHDSARDIVTDDDQFVGLPTELSEHYVLCDVALKPLAVFWLLKKFDWKKTLCFCNNKEAARRLCRLLIYLGLSDVRECSAYVPQKRRQRTMRLFREGKIPLVICSDMLARGMDIDDIDAVLSYDCPRDLRTYVHRAGRTARAGHTGTVVTLVTSPEEAGYMATMNTASRTRPVEKIALAKQDLKTFEDAYKSALQQLKIKTEELGALKVMRKRSSLGTVRRKFKRERET